MRYWSLSALFACALVSGQDTDQPTAAARTLVDVRRIYVEPLTGGASARSLREVIISSLNATGLFILTDDPKRADAVLRGAANDDVFTDSHDLDRSISGRMDAGVYGSGARTVRSGGGYGGSTGNEREAYHIKERKHEAYAAVRLVNRLGDTLWSTTQESQGAKFRSASTDVGAKVARQIAIDMDRVQRAATAVSTRR